MEIKDGNGKIEGHFWENFRNLKLKVEGEYIKGEIKGKAEEYNIEDKLILFKWS